VVSFDLIGSGKTTLLDILAGKRKAGTISGTIKFDEKNANDAALPNNSIGFVDQEDLHLPNLTVREILEFSAKLRLPESLDLEKKKERVARVIEQLGLSDIADNWVGSAVRRGISGGEKRRLSIGVELVTDPSVIFLDEPSSGLDSHYALQVVQTLSTLAKKQGKTIIFTIHQPNSSIFSLLDHVLLLSKGKVAYFGSGSGAAEYCAEKGFPCPPEYHIADHLLDYAIEEQKKNEIPPEIVAVAKQNSGLRRRFLRSSSHTITGDSKVSVLKVSTNSFYTCKSDSQHASQITQFQCVLDRSWKVFWRSPSVFWSHMILSLVLGVFVGFLYYKVDSSFGGIQNRLGSIFFLQSILGFAGLSAIASLQKDKNLFIRERSNGFYGVFPYYVSKVYFQ
jgi:ABC-type multidrug transport system ATPase subunit